MPANVAATQTSSPSGTEALVLLLLALCWEQRREIGRLEQRNEELSRRLGLNSTNSSKPPSSDGLKRKRRTARSPERERRKKLGRKAGKQKGAPGHHLAPVAEPNRVVPLLPALCNKCQGSLVEGSTEVGMEKRQVLDMPPPTGLEATEYQAFHLRCGGCGEVTKAAFPEWVKAPVSYGPRLQAAASYYKVYQHLPYERMAEQFHDVHGVDVSVGALAAMVARGGERVQPAVEEIKRQLQGAPVVSVDETGGHVKGVLKWVHGAATDRLTLLGIDDRRGVVGIRALGVLEELTGIVIHDAWPAYWSAKFEKLSGHGLCNAHHLRELVAVTDLDGQRWSERMTNLLLEMLEFRNAALEAGRTGLEPERLAAFEQAYGRVIREGWRENRKQAGKRQKSKAANLLQRLDEHREEALRFLHDFAVPFTNYADILVMPMSGVGSSCWVAIWPRSSA